MAYKIHKICPVCGKEFYKPRGNKGQITCSRKCGRTIFSKTRLELCKRQVEERLGCPAKEWLEKEYLKKERTLKNIKKELGIGHTQRLVKLLRYLDIPVRTKSEESKLHWRINYDRLIDMTIEKVVTFNQTASLRGPTNIERIMKSALDAEGIGYIPQLRMQRYVCDFVLKDFPIVIECDGEHWHSSPAAKAGDARKDIYLQEHGFTVIRFSDTMIEKHIDQCIQSIKSLMA